MPPFVWNAPPQPYVNTIGDLLRAPGYARADAAQTIGEVQARAALQSGQAWGQGIQQAGQALGSIPERIQQQKAADQASELRGLQIKAGGIDVQEKQKDLEDRQTMSRIYQAAYGMAPSQQPGFQGPTQPGMPQAGAPSTGPDGVPPGMTKGQDGVVTFDRGFLTQAMAAGGLGDKIPDLIAKLTKADEATASLAKTRGEVAVQTQNALGSLAAAVEAAGNTPEAFHMAILHAVSNNTVTLAQVKPFIDAVAADPTKIAAITKQMQAGSPKQTELNTAARTAAAREMTARTGQYSDAGLTQQLTEAALAKQGGIPGGAVQTVPTPTMPPGLPGAVPAPTGPTNINPQTGQPILQPDNIQGGSVNPIAPQLSPASRSMLDQLPPGTPEAPATPTPSAAEVRANAALAAHQAVKEAGMKASADSTITVKTMVNGKPVERVMTKEQALKEGVFPSQPPASMQVNVSPEAKANRTNIAQQLVDGNLPPSMLSKRAGDYNATLAEANKLSLEQTGRPLNLAKLELDYKSAQRFVSSMNGPQMVRFNGLAKSVVNTIDEVNGLSDELKQGGVQLWNRAKRSTIQQVYGNTPQSDLAARYVGAVNTLKEEFANLAQGGFAPNESAWKLANEQINTDFGFKDMNASLREVQRLINFRVHAFSELSPTVLGGGESSAPAPGGSGLVPTMRWNPATGKAEPVK